MADTLDIVTLAEAKTALNVTSGTGNDTEIAQWVTAVSRRIDRMCGAVVQRTLTNELYDGGSGRIWPKWGPVSSVTTLTEYANTTATVLSVETNASKPSDAYLVESFGDQWDWAIRRRGGGADATFAAGRSNVVITYVGGRWANTASVDANFKMAVGAILRRLWQREQGAWAAGADPFEKNPGGSGFFKAVDPMITELLHDEMRPPAVG